MNEAGHQENPSIRVRKAGYNGGTEIYGGIAQLGEHLLCKQGVSGSIPLISTIEKTRGTEPENNDRRGLSSENHEVI